MNKSVKNGLSMGFLTFFLAIIVVSSSRVAVSSLSTGFAFLVLFIIILVGIIFDTIGVAAAAAQQAPFNARAARKDYGARHGLHLVQNAERVATFCSDIIGDICGTVSGALGAILTLRIIMVYQSLSETILNLIIVAAIAALTVGGKGIGKGIGINNANTIIAVVGNIMARLEELKFWKRRGRVSRL